MHTAQCTWLITAEKGATGKLVRKGLGMGKDVCEIEDYTRYTGLGDDVKGGKGQVGFSGGGG